MKEIYISTGEIALVSDEDYDLNQFNWCVGGSKKRYIRRNDDTVQVYMHTVIIERMEFTVTPETEVDHKDRNGFNNQRDNLRLTTKSVNRHNTGLHSNNTSGTKGISFDPTRNKWKVRITVRGIEHSLGRYSTLEEAIKARKEAEKRYGLC